MKTIDILTTCPFCGKETTLTVSLDGYMAWREGELIQRALPELSSNEREMLISGICPECWEKCFGEDHEDEFEDDYDDSVDETGFDPYMGGYSYDC